MKKVTGTTQEVLVELYQQMCEGWPSETGLYAHVLGFTGQEGRLEDLETNPAKSKNGYSHF